MNFTKKQRERFHETVLQVMDEDGWWDRLDDDEKKYVMTGVE